MKMTAVGLRTFSMSELRPLPMVPPLCQMAAMPESQMMMRRLEK